MHVLITLVLLAAQQPAAPGRLRMNLQPLQEAVKSFDGVAGLAARDLLTGEEILINAEARFPTASVIKTAVMVEAHHQASLGRLSLDATIQLREGDKVGGSGVLNGMSNGIALTLRDLIHLMIVLSDNTATNLLIERLGTRNVDARLTALGLEHTRLFRPTFRDGKADIFPELEKEFGLGMSTPREMAKLMELIATGKAVDQPASTAMLETLRRQQDRAMIPRLLPGKLQVGNKTGTDSEKLADERGRRGAIRVDAGIVTGDGVRYVIAVFTRRGGDTRGGVDNAGVLLGAQLARMVHEQFTRK